MRSLRGTSLACRQTSGVKASACLIKQVEDRGAIAMALIENIQREDLNAMEEAQAPELFTKRI